MSVAIRSCAYGVERARCEEEDDRFWPDAGKQDYASSWRAAATAFIATLSLLVAITFARAEDGAKPGLARDARFDMDGFKR